MNGKKAIVCLMAVTMGATSLFSGCGGNAANGNGVVIDPNKTQVYVSAWNGGFGLTWLDEAVKRFNEKSEKAQVIVVPNKDIYQSSIAPAIESGVSTNDIFITAQPYCQDLGIKGYLEDLSDIWASDVDGNGTTVEEKMQDADLFKKVYQTAGGTWGLPHSSAIQGWIYDHGIFVENGWLITENDGVTLTKGKDGVEGTYDDGQPTTMAEWDTMIQNIVQSTVYPFFWNGMADADYLHSMQEALFAQYIGLDNYEITYSYNGTYQPVGGGAAVEITPATGYKTIQLPEKREIINFISKYLLENQNYYHPSSTYKSVSHTDAQAKFILGYNNTTANPQSAMLYDGIWWENEARATFVSLEKRNMKEYTYGTRDYRFMLFPNLDGQIGANGDGTGSVIGISESGTIFLKKQTDEAKRGYAKEFIKYLVSDEVSRLFSVYATGARPYNYELLPSDYENMTTFGKNAYELLSDTENVKMIRLDALTYLSQMNYFTTPTVSRWGSSAGGRDYTNAFSGIKNSSAAEYYAGMSAFANETYWNPIYQSYLNLQ